METYYTVDQVADIFQVKKRTVWDWIRNDKLIAICMSNHNYRIAESDLKSFANSKKKIKVKK